MFLLFWPTLYVLYASGENLIIGLSNLNRLKCFYTEKTVYTIFRTHKERYSQMINSDLIQTLLIDRLNLRMNNREKIFGGDLLWRPTEAPKPPIFERF